MSVCCLEYIEKKAVSYRSDKSEGPTAGPETVNPLEFLARVLVHIPDQGHVTRRYYGWYANRRRGMRRPPAHWSGPVGGRGDLTSVGRQGATTRRGADRMTRDAERRPTERRQRGDRGVTDPTWAARGLVAPRAAARHTPDPDKLISDRKRSRAMASGRKRELIAGAR